MKSRFSKPVCEFPRFPLLLRIIGCLPTSRGLRITSAFGAGVGPSGKPLLDGRRRIILNNCGPFTLLSFHNANIFMLVLVWGFPVVVFFF
jgi:hypothetical protein